LELEVDITYSFDPSMSAIVGQALKPIASLHHVSGDVPMSWFVKATASPIVDRGSMVSPVRDGVVTFHIGSSHNVVTVAVQVIRLMKFDEDETWIGKHVCCKAGTWSWAYYLDWKTGNMSEQIELGQYPFSFIDLSNLAHA
jgi:hypothetical protein